jgi:hypothetical protein
MRKAAILLAWCLGVGLLASVIGCPSSTDHDDALAAARRAKDMLAQNTAELEATKLEVERLHRALAASQAQVEQLSGHACGMTDAGSTSRPTTSTRPATTSPAR